MKIGNILAAIGIVLGVVGILCLPLRNLHDLPYLADTSYPGSVWIVLAQNKILMRPGIIIMVLGGVIYLVAKRLPYKYWEGRKPGDNYKDILTKKKKL